MLIHTFQNLSSGKVFKSEHYLDLHLERRHMDEAKIAAKRGSTCTFVKKKSHMVYVLMMLMGVSGYGGLGVWEENNKSSLRYNIPFSKKTQIRLCFLWRDFWWCCIYFCAKWPVFLRFLSYASPKSKLDNQTIPKLGFVYKVIFYGFPPMVNHHSLRCEFLVTMEDSLTHRIHVW